MDEWEELLQRGIPPSRRCGCGSVVPLRTCVPCNKCGKLICAQCWHFACPHCKPGAEAAWLRQKGNRDAE